MSELGADIHAEAYADIPEIRASLLCDDGVTSVACICSSVELTRVNRDEFGMTQSPSCIVRVLLTNEPETGLEQGKVITLTDYSGQAYRLRIHSRMIKSGELILTMVAENG